MNLQAMLAARIESRNLVRVGLIGAGKFGSMSGASAHDRRLGRAHDATS
jgi:predicted homoserine dehydrogenase-like protein